MIMRFVILIISMLIGLAAHADFASPDFAYPKQAIDDAEVMLTSQDGQARFKAIMEIVKAKSEIDPDSISTMITFVSKSAKMERDVALRHLYYLYEAQLIGLNGDRSQSVDSLLELAEKDIDNWGREPLSNFSSIINVEKSSKEFYSKLWDFVYTKASDLNPGMADAYATKALSLSAKNTPAWAMWTCRGALSDKEILQLYSTHDSGLSGAYILLNICQSHYNIEVPKKIELIKGYLNSNSPNALTETLKGWLNRLMSAEIRVEAPEVVTPTNNFQIKCIHSFTSNIELKIYKVTNPSSNKAVKTLFKTLKKSTDPTSYQETCTFNVVLDQVGNYEIFAQSKDISQKAYKPSSNLIVTNLIPLGMRFDGKAVIAAANFEDGAPSHGNSISLVDYQYPKQKWVSGVTDGNGFATLNFSAKNSGSYGGNISIAQNNTDVLFNEGVWGRSWTPSGTSIVGCIFVSRPVYHPGDSLEWSAVIAEKNYTNLRSHLIVNKDVRIVFNDANYQPIDTLNLLTDEFGRVYGIFRIPEDRLSGKYPINIMLDDRNICSNYVLVSDYKAPVFEVTDLNVHKNDSAYIVTGRAKRFTGVPVVEANVNITIESIPSRWFINHLTSINMVGMGETDSTGNFQIEIPFDEIQDGVEPYNLRCNALVTNSNAETAESSTIFRTGKQILLVSQLADSAIDCSEIAKFNITSLNLNNDYTPVDFKWELKRSENGESVYKGFSRTDSIKTDFDWKEVVPGNYNLYIEPSDTSICNTLEIKGLWIYNSAKNLIPEKLALVVPKKLINDIEGNSVEIEFGIGSPSYVYAFGVDSLENIFSKVEKFTAGFHKIKIAIDNRDRQDVSVMIVRDGQVYSERIRLLRPEPSTSLAIEYESLRDRSLPGQNEEITLKIQDKAGNGANAAIIISMYNDALRLLNPNFAWPNILEVIQAPKKNYIQNFINSRYSFNSFIYSNPSAVSYFNVETPQFLYTPNLRYISGNIRYLRATNGIMEKQAYMKDYASPAMSTLANDEVAVEEAVSEDVGSSSEGRFSPNNDLFRDIDISQALWMPSVVTSPNGMTVIKFTMPNALGRWDFRATAWTTDMRAASLLQSLVTSKPVMVQSNIPRFLRRGDSAVIGGTVINNTDSILELTTAIEIFNPQNNEIISSEVFKQTFKPNEQKVLSIGVNASYDSEFIGYRVRTSAAGYTDGEQGIIPIFPSETKVIDSQIFYLDENDKSFKTTIPAMKGKDDIIAVEYCQNPVWEAVKSLPGLYTDKPGTSLEASRALFAALTAKNLYSKYPEISEILTLWKSNPADSSLVSELNKNEDLKLMALSQTPFVGSANANTAQMERLATTFESSVISKVLDTSISRLGKLQHPDGGFGWGDWSRESSTFITQSVLMNIGRAKVNESQRDIAKLNLIIRKALNFLDSKIKTEEVNYSYALVYGMFPNLKPSNLKGQNCLNHTKQEILRSWKGHNTFTKALDAMILNSLGNKNTAKEIIRSIEQFAINSHTKGVTFPSVSSIDDYATILRAFNELAPKSDINRGLRKWLFLNTQVSDDLCSWNPTALISSLLEGDGVNWISVPSHEIANVSIDGKPVVISDVEAATGHFSDRLTPSNHKRIITFTCPESTKAAYGSVTVISNQQIDSVSARSTGELSINRKISIWRNGKWIESDTISFGDRVRINIMVETSRNFEYIAIHDERAAAFEPENQMPGWSYDANIAAYREFNDQATNYFIDYLPKGKFTFTYYATAAYPGDFSSGIATVQSQYAPEFTARSGACRLKVLR